MRLGDASEYILTTQSLRFDRDFRYTPTDLARHQRTKPNWFDSPAGLRTARGLDGGEYLLWHSFYYPLAAIPFYALFGFRGFYLFNGLLFCLTALLVYRWLRRFNTSGVSWTWALLGLLLSAAPCYLVWIHPETFLMTVCAAGLYFQATARPRSAAMFFGIAAGAQPILVGLAAAGLLLVVLRSRRWLPAISVAVIFLLFAVPPYVVNWVVLGSAQPMLATNAVGASSVTLAKLVRSLIDPAGGIVWFYPVIVASLVRAPRTLRTLVLLSGVMAVLVLAGFSWWYSHQVGLRYGSYVLPAFLLIPERVGFSRWSDALAWTFAAFSGTGLAVNPVGNSAGMDIDQKFFPPYRIVRRLPFYPEDHSVTWYRMGQISPTVGLNPIWPDHWVPGDQRVQMMIRRPGSGTLSIDVDAGPRASLATLRIASEPGRELALSLRAGVNTLTIPRTSLRETRFEDWPETSILLRLTVAGFYPSESIPGSHDPRRLGVRFLRVAFGNDVRFPAD
jgi:hypothetical protein